jgi:hypothetical protein
MRYSIVLLRTGETLSRHHSEAAARRKIVALAPAYPRTETLSLISWPGGPKMRGWSMLSVDGKGAV